MADRLVSAGTWLLGPIGSTEPLALAMGAILVGSAASYARWLFYTDQTQDPGLAKKAMILTWAVWLVGIPLLKPGWIPGLMIAAPAAIFGMVGGVSERRWTLLALSVLPVPVIFATAFVDGSAVQWGSRYLLPTSLALMVVGIESLRRVSKPTFAMVVAVSLLTTMSGSAWTLQRSHWIADDGQRVVELTQGEVVVWESGYTAREMADYSSGQRWLTVESRELQSGLASLLVDEDIQSFVWIANRGLPAPSFEGFESSAVIGSFSYETAFPADLTRYVRSDENLATLAFESDD